VLAQSEDGGHGFDGCAVLDPVTAVDAGDGLAVADGEAVAMGEEDVAAAVGAAVLAAAVDARQDVGESVYWGIVVADDVDDPAAGIVELEGAAHDGLLVAQPVAGEIAAQVAEVAIDDQALGADVAQVVEQFGVAAVRCPMLRAWRRSA
jgi:hypothetical protein